MKRLAFLASATAALFGAPSFAEEVHPLFSKGKAAYVQLCAKCHGNDMVNPGTSSFDLRKFPTDQKERFYDSVNNGTGDMPAWADVLFEGELDAIWVYVATRAGKEPFPDEAAAAPPESEIASELMAPGTLTACLARNGGALSGKRADGGSGLDYRLVEMVAGHLDLELDVTWFESEQEEESDPVRETYAMLSEPLCDVTASQPLYEGAFGAPPAETASLPRWDEIPDWWGTRQTALKPIDVTRPYIRAEIGLAIGPGVERDVKGLRDLDGLTLGFQQGTLSGAIATMQATPDAIARSKTFNPGPKFLWEIETGRADVAIVDTAAFDFHLKQNPISKLRLAEWRHGLGINIGLAASAEKPALVAAMSAIIEDAVESGEIARIAEAEGVTYARPRAPFVLGRINRTTLAGYN